LNTCHTQYVKSVAEGKCPDHKTKSFDTVKQCVADPLLLVQFCGIWRICWH